MNDVDVLSQHVQNNAPEPADEPVEFNEESLLQMGKEVGAVVQGNAPANQSATTRQQQTRFRKHAGTEAKMQEAITEYLNSDTSCETSMQCFAYTDFVRRVCPYKFDLKPPFNVDEYATVQTFKKLLKKEHNYPESEFPYDRNGKFYKHVRYDSPFVQQQV